MSKSTHEKAQKYLADGKVQIVAHSSDVAVLKVEGSDWQPYTVVFGPGGWSCSCPARLECAHILAAKLISPHRPTQAVSLGGADAETQSFMDSLVHSGPSDDEDANSIDY